MTGNCEAPYLHKIGKTQSADCGPRFSGRDSGIHRHLYADTGGLSLDEIVREWLLALANAATLRITLGSFLLRRRLSLTGGETGWGEVPNNSGSPLPFR